MDARKAYLTELELWAYNLSKRAEWDAYAIKETAMKDGRAEATEERNTVFVKNLLQHTSHPIEEIAKLVGVTAEFVAKESPNFVKVPEKGLLSLVSSKRKDTQLFPENIRRRR